MTKQFPLPGAPALPCAATAKPKLPVRALAHLMARRTILTNLTDQPISLAQFNCLMAEHAPQKLKQICLMHKAAEAVCDPLLAIVHENKAASTVGAQNTFPDFLYLLPSQFAEMNAEIGELVDATTNTLAQHLSQFGNPHAAQLPIKSKVKPLPPEAAAWQWAEAMEAQLAHPTASAG
ncbi:hypothetical protein [uncultured Cohaesibacter sp.]|uniref:hypothetical protein n=1 Tax=uncultured Cohaesibacter sp. TaxID=1002546 RepID=UPI002AABC781|nr:hypothetical protein [uncultured Cohaesibacter sp.]